MVSMGPRQPQSVLAWPLMAVVVSLAYPAVAGNTGDFRTLTSARHEDAYVVSISATGLPEDYVLYIATRVMLQSLKRVSPKADIVALVSRTLPQKWIAELEKDGIIVRRVDDIPSPWAGARPRTRPWNKLWAWRLVEYRRVVLLDHDNVFLLNVDELFQCGDFCAVFINPCYFHTGLLVIRPSDETFKELHRQLPVLARDVDSEHQFFNAFRPNLLDGDLFMPLPNNTRQSGLLRLPLGYQMDASFYYYKLRWMVDCSSKSVVSFPEVLGLVPWYWYSWPLLPLGFMWHEIRRTTIGYRPERLWILIQALAYVTVAVCAVFVRRKMFSEPLSALGFVIPCHLASFEGGKTWSGTSAHVFGLRLLTLGAMGVAFALPASMVPLAVHPLMGWGLFLLGSLSLLIVLIIVMHLPVCATLSPWFFTIVALCLMSAHGFVDLPGLSSGLFRFLSIGLLAFLGSPVMFHALKQIVRSVGSSDFASGREPFLGRPWQNEPSSELAKVC